MPTSPGAREHPPVAPHRRVAALDAVRLVEGVRLDVARVHPLVEDVEGVPLARGLDAADEDDDGELFPAHDVGLSAEEALAQARDFGVVGLGVDLVAELGGLEHASYARAITAGRGRTRGVRPESTIARP